MLSYVIDNTLGILYHGAMQLLLYLLLCLIWGSTWMAIKIGLKDAPPVWSAAIRFIIAVGILAIINRISGQQYPKTWRNKFRVAWPGILSFFFSYYFVYTGSQYISSALAAILFATFPFVVLLLMPLMIKDERVTLRALIGAIIGFAGIVLVYAEPTQLGGKALLGMILLTLSPVVSAISNVAIKAYLSKEAVFPMMTLQMALGGLLLMITALFTEDLSDFRFTTRATGAILYLAIFGSVIAFNGYYWLLKRWPLTTMSMIAFITPIVAIFLGNAVLGEKLTVIDFVGSALVLVGVLIVVLRKSQGSH